MNGICINIRKIKKFKCFYLLFTLPDITHFSKETCIKINTLCLIFILQRLLDIFIVNK